MMWEIAHGPVINVPCLLYLKVKILNSYYVVRVNEAFTLNVM